VDTEISENEWAVALAAWVSIHYLAPIPMEEDHIAAAIHWKDDIGDVASFGEFLFPSNPDKCSYRDINRATLEVASRVLPSGSAKALWQYNFFEWTADAAATDPDALLAMVADALRNRRLTPEIAPARIGPYVIGSLGVITTGALEYYHGAAKWFEYGPIPGSYAEYARALNDSDWCDTVICADHQRINYQGWCPAWVEWHRRNVRIHHHSAPELFFKHHQGEEKRWGASYRRRSGPNEADLSDSDLAPLSQWPWSGLKRVLKSDDTDFSQVLADCIQYKKSVFFENIDWRHAAGGRDFLTHDQDSIEATGLRQILMLAPPELVVASAIDRGYLTLDGHWGASFSECLTSALLRVYATADCRSLLTPFMRNAGGPDYDRLLHWVVKADPAKVLEQQVNSNPLIASALARLTCAPSRFHAVNGWDPGDPQQAAALISHIRKFLREEQPPSPPERALPFAQAAQRVLDGMSALDGLSSARRRTEYLFKTAIQYLYALLAWYEAAPNSWPANCREPSYRPLIIPMPFWDDQPFVKAITWGLKTVSGKAMTVPTDAKMVLSDLRALLAAAGKLVKPDSPSPLIAVRNAQKEMDAALAEPGWIDYVNHPNHDNPSTILGIEDIRKKLAAFDSRVRRIEDALPSFALFVKLTAEPNRPKVVQIAPYEPLGIMHGGFKEEHYLTNRDLEFRRDRIYSFTDVTRNQVSVNPVILDWTEWMEWSAIPDK